MPNRFQAGSLSEKWEFACDGAFARALRWTASWSPMGGMRGTVPLASQPKSLAAAEFRFFRQTLR
jgi:hypothetical protein